MKFQGMAEVAENDTAQPDEDKPHQPQSSHAVTKYEVRAGESGGANGRTSP
jgi:hypothetical protein